MTPRSPQKMVGFLLVESNGILKSSFLKTVAVRFFAKEVSLRLEHDI